MSLMIAVLALAGPWRGRLFGAIILWSLESLASVLPLGIIAFAVAAVADPAGAAAWSLPPPRPEATVALAAGAMAAALGLRWLLFHAGARLAYTAGYRLTERTRLALAGHLRTLPLEYFDRRDSGTVASVLMNDVALLELFPGTILPRVIAGVLLPLTAVGLTAAADWRLGLLLAATVAAGWTALGLGGRLSRAVSERRAAAMGGLHARMLEFVFGIQVIRAFGLTVDRLKAAREAMEEARDASKALVARTVLAAVAAPLVIALGLAALLWLAGMWLAEGTLGIGAFVLVALAGLRLVAPLQELAEFAILAQQMSLAHGRIAATMGSAAPAVPPVPATRPDGHDIGFEAVDLIHADGTRALSGVSFTAQAGHVTALVGETGAGKTTVARLLAGAWQPTAGRITLGGADLRDIPPDVLADRIAVVSQTVVLFSLSVRDNIRLGRPDASDAEVEAAARAARCHDLITALPHGYDTILENGGAALSGGERQRLSLARLFLKDSPILILDEATSSLDVENERLVQEALRDLTRGRTVLVIAHRLWSIRHADRIVVLDHGRVAEIGDDATLRAAGGTYARLWAALRGASGWRGARSAHKRECE